MDLLLVWVGTGTGTVGFLGMVLAWYCILDKWREEEDSWLHLLNKWLRASFVSITLVGSFGLALHVSIVVPIDLEERLAEARAELDRLEAALAEAQADRDESREALIAALGDGPDVDTSALEALLRELFADLERELRRPGFDASGLESELERLQRQIQELLDRRSFLPYSERVAWLERNDRANDEQLTRDLRALLGPLRVDGGPMFWVVPVADREELVLRIEGNRRTSEVAVVRER